MIELTFDGKTLRPIPGFEGYFVSAYGDIFTDRQGPLRSRKTYLLRGYFQFSAYRRGKPTLVRVNRAVALAWIGPPPSSKHQAAHGDGNSRNNHWMNLRWATKIENEADKLAHGTRCRGESHGRAKLTTQDVMRILEAKRTKGRFWGAAQLAKEMGVSVRTMHSVAQGRRWIPPFSNPEALEEHVTGRRS